MITTCDARYHRLWERVKSCVTGNFKEANKYPTKRFATIYPMTARNENRAGERVWCDVQPSLHAKCLTLRVPLLRGVVLERFSAHYCFFKQEETKKKRSTAPSGWTTPGPISLSTGAPKLHLHKQIINITIIINTYHSLLSPSRPCELGSRS